MFEMKANRVLCVGCNTLIRKEMFYKIQLQMVIQCYARRNADPPYAAADHIAETSEEQCD